MPFTGTTEPAEVIVPVDAAVAAGEEPQPDHSRVQHYIG